MPGWTELRSRSLPSAITFRIGPVAAVFDTACVCDNAAVPVVPAVAVTGLVAGRADRLERLLRLRDVRQLDDDPVISRRLNGCFGDPQTIHALLNGAARKVKLLFGYVWVGCPEQHLRAATQVEAEAGMDITNPQPHLTAIIAIARVCPGGKVDPEGQERH